MREGEKRRVDKTTKKREEEIRVVNRVSPEKREEGSFFRCVVLLPSVS